MKARFQTTPLAVKIGIAILIVTALWVLVFFLQRWIGPESMAEAQIAATLGML